MSELCLMDTGELRQRMSYVPHDRWTAMTSAIPIWLLSPDMYQDTIEHKDQRKSHAQDTLPGGEEGYSSCTEEHEL
jgi:hypothetical protein